MLRIFQLFIDIALWRKGPQDVPASSALLVIVLTWYVGVSYVLARVLGFSIGVSLGLIIIDTAITVGWLLLILSIVGRRARFQQSITATLGVGVLLSLVNVAVLALAHLFGIPQTQLAGWMLMQLILILLAYGRIVSVTIERRLVTGMAITFAMLILSDVAQMAVRPAAVASVAP